MTMNKSVFSNELINIGHHTVEGLDFTHLYIRINGDLPMIAEFLKLYGGSFALFKSGMAIASIIRRDMCITIAAFDLQPEKIADLLQRYPEEVQFEKGSEVVL
jgi:hypothetical protein